MRLTEKRGALLLRIGAILMSLVAAVTSVYAWQSMNRVVEDDDLDVQIDAYSINVMPMTTYWEYLEDEQMEYRKSTGAKIDLPKYDSVFIEQNEYSRIFIRVPVFGKTVNFAEPFTASLSIKDMDAGKGYVGSAANNNHYEYDTTNSRYSDIVALYLSNVVSIKCTTIPSLNGISSEATDTASIQNICDTAKTTFASLPPKTFLNNSTKEKLYDTVTFEFSGYDSARLEPETGIYELYLYFEIAYDADLIQNLMEHHDLEIGVQEYVVKSDFFKLTLDVAS